MGIVNMNEIIEPTITTFIPTYQRPKLLRRAIRSVLNQTYPHFLVCVYDNASGDETGAVVSEIAKEDPRVKYHCHSENIGAFNNFQYGLEHIETPFFSILADDDIVLPEFYETALAGFESHPDAMFSATDVIHVGIQGNILKMALETWTPGFYRPPDGLKAILEHGHSEWHGMLLRKAVAEDIGLPDVETGKFSDLDFTLRIAARCPFVVSKRPGAVFNLSMSHERKPYPFDLIWPGGMKMIRNLTDDESLPLDVRTYAKRILWGIVERDLVGFSLSHLSRGSSDDAKKIAALIRDQFGGRARYIALSAIINTCQYVPFARLAFDSLVACRRHLRAKRVNNSQEQYREYEHYLDDMQ